MAPTWVADLEPLHDSNPAPGMHVLARWHPRAPVSRSRSSPVPEVVAYFRHGYATVQEPVSWDGVGKRITLVVANSE